jgi:hypothetical protein
MDCKRCGYPLVHDDGEWLGEKEGKGGVMIITTASCCNCNHRERIEPLELTGM